MGNDRMDIDDLVDKRAEEFMRHPARKIFKWIIISVVAALVLGTGLWAFGVFSSPLQGKGDAYAKKNSSDNWVTQQGRFERLFADVKTADQNLDNFSADLAAFNKAHPNYQGNGQVIDPLMEQLQTLQGAVTAAKKACVATQNDYTALTRQYLAADFKAHDLPFEFTASDPAFIGGKWDFSNYDCVATASK